MDDKERQSAFISALTTEHFVLQTAMNLSASDAESRASLYIFSLSSALVAMGFASRSQEVFVPFIATVLPALFLLGVFTVRSFFKIKDERHARYWMDQAFPVLLVIRSSEGEVRWMEVRDWLKRESDNGKMAVRQIVFEGERFDVMSVRRWRERALGEVES